MVIDKRAFELKLRKILSSEDKQVEYPKEILKEIERFFRARNLDSGMNVPNILVSLLNLMQVNNHDVIKLQKLVMDNLNNNKFKPDEIFYIISSMYSNVILGNINKYTLKYKDKSYEINMFEEMVQYYTDKNMNPDLQVISKALINLIDTNLNSLMIDLELDIIRKSEELEIKKDPNLYYILSAVLNSIQYQALAYIE
jgi:hypothetical protein